MRPPWEELEPASQRAHQRQRQAVRDVALLSSVVCVAVVAAVALHTIHHIATSVPTPGSLPDALRAWGAELTTILLTLLAIFTVWILHHLQVHYLTRVDGVLLLLHVILFSTAVLLLVSAALLNTLGSTRSAVSVFAGNVFALQFLLLLIWRHAVKAGLLFGSDVPSRVVTRLRLLLQFGTASSIAAAGLAWAGVSMGIIALAVLLIVQLAFVATGGYTLSFRKDNGRMT